MPEYKFPDNLPPPRATDWDEVADRIHDQTADMTAGIIMAGINETDDDHALMDYVREHTATMPYRPVTIGDLFGAALQAKQDITEDDADPDTAYEQLVEGLRDFALMHRGNPCECGNDPCIAVIPLDLLISNSQ